MIVATPEQTAKLAEIDARIAAAQQRLAAPSPAIDAAQAVWERGVAQGPTELPWSPVHPEKATGDKGSQLVVRADETIKVEVAGNPPEDTFRIGVRLAKGATGLRLEVLPSQSLPAGGPGRAGNGNFVLSEFGLEQEGKPVKLSKATATFEQTGFPAKNAIDGIANKKQNGWAVMGNTGQPATAYFQLEVPLKSDAPVTVILQQHYGENHTLGKFRLSATSATGPIEAPNASIPADVLAAEKVPAAQRTPEQRSKIATHFRSIAPELAPIRAQIADAQKERVEFEKALGRCLVSEHSDQLRTVRIRPRGNWQDDSGEIVAAGACPHFLPQPSVEAGRRLTRLDLGQWLVDRQNPLTARVFTNRLWNSTSASGFRRRSTTWAPRAKSPVMQPLLDWLACEFMDSAWDIKHMVRLMVTSGAYRQSSQALEGASETRSVQPRARPSEPLSPRRRVRARQRPRHLRAARARRSAAPSVKPYQPAGYWENLNFPAREWEADKDENQWRRGLYTWWQRSYLHPSLAGLRRAQPRGMHRRTDALEYPAAGARAAQRSRLTSRPPAPSPARILREGGADPAASASPGPGASPLGGRRARAKHRLSKRS